MHSEYAKARAIEAIRELVPYPEGITQTDLSEEHRLWYGMFLLGYEAAVPKDQTLEELINHAGRGLINQIGRLQSIQVPGVECHQPTRKFVSDLELIPAIATWCSDLLSQVLVHEKELNLDNEGYHDLTTLQSKFLTEVANLLNGTPPDLTLWSHHNVGELLKTGLSKLSELLMPQQLLTLEQVVPLVVTLKQELEAYRRYANRDIEGQVEEALSIKQSTGKFPFED